MNSPPGVPRSEQVEKGTEIVIPPDPGPEPSPPGAGMRPFGFLLAAMAIGLQTLEGAHSISAWAIVCLLGSAFVFWYRRKWGDEYNGWKSRKEVHDTATKLASEHAEMIRAERRRIASPPPTTGSAEVQPKQTKDVAAAPVASERPNAPLGLSPEKAWDELKAALMPAESLTLEQRQLLEWVDAGGDVNWRGPKAMTLLHFASINGNTAMVRALVRRGADIEAKEETTGATPLSVACVRTGESAIPVLLELGANPHAKAADGYTPYALVQQFMSSETKTFIERFAASEPGCAECGSPSPNALRTRGVTLRFKLSSAELMADYTCKKCRHDMDFPLTAVSTLNGGLLGCPECGTIVLIPPSVWCATCGQSFSSNWQTKIRPA